MNLLKSKNPGSIVFKNIIVVDFTNVRGKEKRLK
jgi:hypothetical protein